MRIECGFQANHSGYWWDSAITVRFDNTVDVPNFSPPKRHSEDADDPHLSRPEDPLDDRFPLFASALSNPVAYESLMEAPGLPIRKHRHGDIDDPEAKVDLKVLEGFWEAATSPVTGEALANLSTALTLYDAVEHLTPVLDLPGVRAVDVMLYLNGLESYMPHAHAIFRFVPDGRTRILVRVASMDGDPQELRDLARDLVQVLGWSDAPGTANGAKQDRSWTLCLAEANEHCREFRRNYYCSKAQYDLVQSIYTAMGKPEASLASTLGDLATDLYRVMEIAIRVELVGLLRPDPRPALGPEPPHLTGKSRFWNSAGERAIAYLVRMHDSHNSSSVISLMSLASPTLAVPFFRHLLNESRIEAMLLHRIRACRMTDLIPDLIALVERDVTGCYSEYIDVASFRFSHSTVFGLMYSVFLAIKELMSTNDYENLLLSAYHTLPGSEAPKLRFTQPFSVVAEWAFPGLSVTSGASETPPSGKRRSLAELQADGHCEFLDSLLRTILQTVEGRAFPERLLMTGALSLSQEEVVRKHLESC